MMELIRNMTSFSSRKYVDVHQRWNTEGRELGFVIRGIITGSILNGMAMCSLKGCDVLEKVGCQTRSSK